MHRRRHSWMTPRDSVGFGGDSGGGPSSYTSSPATKMHRRRHSSPSLMDDIFLTPRDARGSEVGFRGTLSRPEVAEDDWAEDSVVAVDPATVFDSMKGTGKVRLRRHSSGKKVKRWVL